MDNRRVKGWLMPVIASLIFLLLISNMSWWEKVLGFLFPGQSQLIYPHSNLLTLVGEHLHLVLISSSITILVGIPLGIGVTRPGGKGFLPIVANITSFGQSFPPVAVLALAVPLFGFGKLPTVLALFLYGLLPVVRNTIAGLQAVPTPVLDTAYGLGMTRFQALVRIEIPLAAQMIMAGVRTSVIINIGTAMIGAVVGAGGLGSPIVAGLVHDNIAYIIQGALPASMLAIIVDRFLAAIEGLFTI